MQPIKIDLPREQETVEIHLLSDWHIGDPNCLRHLIDNQIASILSKPNAYCFVVGDLCNNATKASVSNVYDDVLSPMQQLEVIRAYLEPLAKDGRILAVVPGNHEERTYKSDGLDMMKIICTELQITDRYRPTAAYVFVRMGHGYEHLKSRNTYGVYINHGNGGGRTVGGKANALARQMEVADADLYISGHTHLPMIFKDRFIRPTFGSMGLTSSTHTFINTNAVLDYGGYGERAGYRPSALDIPRIFMYSGHKKIEAIL